MKKLFKKLSAKSGFQILKREFMPCGIDLARDISRDVNLAEIKTIFDVGANVGNMALDFSRAFNDSKVYAFEPIQETFRTLCERTSGCSMIERHQLAFSDLIGSASVFLQADCGLNSLSSAVNVMDSKLGERTERVVVDTINNFCNIKSIDRIDLLKTDTEGLDVRVLRGAEQLLQDRRIRYILCEVTFDSSNSRNTQFTDVQNFLEGYDFKLRAFYDQSDFGKASFMTCCNALFLQQ